MINSANISKQTLGRVFQINISAGGVPKKSVDECRVTQEGIKDDNQKNKNVHGGQERALCLYSLELILRLQEEGHAVFPGALGENLTISGIDWGLVVPGARMKIGKDVHIEVTSFTSPCRTIAQYFHEGGVERISNTTHEGWSRVYTRVLQGGDVRIGDVVRVDK